MKGTKDIISGLKTLLSDSSYRIAENFDGSQNRTNKVVLIDIDSLTLIPAVVHDYLYEFGSIHGVSRKQADRYLFQALECSNFGDVKSYLVYLAVRSFGWMYWYK